jgi:hypothetical protein
MTHIHWIARQNKLEIRRDKDEVNKREIHECDGRAHDPTTMVSPLTTTRETETLVRTPTIIVSCREEDTVLRKWSWSRYCSTNCILVTKTQVGITTTKAPDPRTTNRHTKPKPSPGLLRPLSHFEKKTLS